MKAKLKIKVCGLNDVENMTAVDELGVNYVGLIFYKKSPRFITTKHFSKTKAKKIGVFVNKDFKSIIKTVRDYNLHGIQLHGHETPEEIQVLRDALLKDDQLGFIEIWKAIPIKTKTDIEQAKAYEYLVDKLVFDTKAEQLGGTGQKFDWTILSNYRLSTHFLLSGGISTEDAEAIKNLELEKLEGVDLNSKFELKPGLKNTTQLNTFIKNLNHYENKPV